MKKQHLKFCSLILIKKINNKFQSKKGLINMHKDIESLVLFLFYKRNIYKMIKTKKLRNLNHIGLFKLILFHLCNLNLKVSLNFKLVIVRYYLIKMIS